ncbi:Protein of unknown function [Roseateles sp. YR242]|uniref:bestrophin-like domain n=1 Tax=Roseateles sp. YR242 TaxID=1855305 RepID=UPI0008D36B7E|nr:DUF4239 domain-containing protein [Roseateles sp. YR242]SEL38406.1 Protein of unknown function [Roseateles sp. YR242]
MPLWIYNMSDWLLAGLVVGGCAVLGVGGHALRHRCWPGPVARRDLRLLLGVVVAMAGLATLLLGQCAAAGWEASASARQAMQKEAAAIGGLGRSLSLIPRDESRLAREQLKAYTRAVILKEWPAMQEGQSSLATWDAFDTLFRSLADIQPGSPGERALMPEVWTRINELLRLRHKRLENLQGAIPGALWAVTAASSGLALGLLSLLPGSRGPRTVAALTSVVIGLGLFLAIALDRPLCPGVCTMPLPFETALQRLERWDSKVLPMAPS